MYKNDKNDKNESNLGRRLNMIELGKIQKLEVVNFTTRGVYLNSKNNEDEKSILLPKKQVPSEIKEGDELEVFVYRDSKDRLIATTHRPKIIIGEFAYLKVVDITRIGAFLDWGLEKDLFMPFKEQRGKIKKSREYLVGIYIDKSSRLCATMDIYKLLSSESPYKENDKVHGFIYNINNDIGAFVAVDNKYHGLIPKHELFGDYKLGSEVDAIVTKVRKDGKLDLNLRGKAYKQMDKDTKLIMDKLNDNGGVLSINDKSSPKEIKDEFNISKSAFKRAVGRLLKQRKIKITEKGIEISKSRK